ncbi:sulfurtransferase TusA family protein [Acetobacter ghanensis]|uniref:SirA family protein n=1 Tax=Acetobacter ghanensis TaxID=431306 RepID=A0A0U5F870_9PROT|nr:sulfurtransferase TusA family protein [Acetobacter ghanensis]NHO38106.1 sulfurtransferase TusA family protein [Acetobacter ghanensis]CEF56087.1 SirA family protein [Acetobacter ghanensis]
MTDTVLDVRGLSCPLPVLKANRVLRGLPAGARLRVLATDRASVTDFQVFCRETGHALVSFADENGIFSFTIKRCTQDA